MKPGRMPKPSRLTVGCGARGGSPGSPGQLCRVAEGLRRRRGAGERWERRRAVRLLLAAARPWPGGGRLPVILGRAGRGPDAGTKGPPSHRPVPRGEPRSDPPLRPPAAQLASPCLQSPLARSLSLGPRPAGQPALLPPGPGGGPPGAAHPTDDPD